MADPATQQQPVTVSQRRAQIEQARFIELRQLVYMQYKKPDGSPLMLYEETLDDRNKVFDAILRFELEQGWLIPDGTESALQQQVPQNVPQQSTQSAPAVSQGAAQMNMPFAPGVPQQAPAAQPQQQFAAPTGAPPPMFAPGAVQGAPMFSPQPPQAAPMAPQQAPQPAYAAPQAPQAPQQQEAPAAAPTGRGRGRMKAAGNAVAPPPAPAPAPQAAPGPQFAAPQAAQAPAQFVPGAPAQQPFVPQAAPAFAPQAAPAPVQTAPVQAAQIDLSPIVARLDATGVTVESTQKKLDEVLNNQRELLANQNAILVALHHMYASNPALQSLVGEVKDAGAFKAYLKKYVSP